MERSRPDTHRNRGLPSATSVERGGGTLAGTHDRGACLNRPAREEKNLYKKPTAKSLKPVGHQAHPTV